MVDQIQSGCEFVSPNIERDALCASIHKSLPSGGQSRTEAGRRQP